MGILNVTPDSFYDGGRFDGTERAVAKALEMLADGADWIDVGGESTGPNSENVSVKEELARVIPVIEGMKVRQISIDTWKAAVAENALDAGASMVNDVTAGRGDPAMFALIAERGCSYVMMRSKDPTPRTTVKNEQYDDVIKTIHEFFEERIAAAERAGVKKSQLILDPGLGHFVSSDSSYSWEILERLTELHDLGCPILVSPSRKSFTAEHGEPPDDRLPGTLKATRLAVEHGATIIRTHDVKETQALLKTRMTKLE